MELDHLFITVPHPGVGDRFTELGFTEASPKQHPGQGTANRRFFFENAFIELLYLTDREEATRPLTAPTRLFERLTDRTGAVSPFGVCFRPSDVDERPAFPYWDYRPDYLPSGLSIPVAEAPPSEPMWFFLPFGRRPDQAPPERAEPLVHTCEARAITRVWVSLPSVSSEAARQAAAVPGIMLAPGEAHHLTIELDDHRQGKVIDLAPELPVTLLL